MLPGKDIEKVASMPTRDQALSMLLGVLKAPIQKKLVGTIAAPNQKLVRTLAAVRDAKQAAAPDARLHILRSNDNGCY